MKTGKGVVKKYSREYNRTLKNGEKKKYTTKQIQITIPKHDDIYEDKEEVLIIPQSEIEEFKNLEDKVSALEIANYIYTNEIETTPKVNVEAFENEINQLKQEKDQLLSTLENESSKLETSPIEILFELVKHTSSLLLFLYKFAFKKSASHILSCLFE